MRKEGEPGQGKERIRHQPRRGERPSHHHGEGERERERHQATVHRPWGRKCDASMVEEHWRRHLGGGGVSRVEKGRWRGFVKVVQRWTRSVSGGDTLKRHVRGGSASRLVNMPSNTEGEGLVLKMRGCNYSEYRLILGVSIKILNS
jgi:hypothetical protein